MPSVYGYGRSGLTAAVYAAAGLGIGFLVPAFVRSFRGYLALGPGGLPYNIFGWALQAMAWPFSVDPHDVDALEHPSAATRALLGPAAEERFLGQEAVPDHVGPRPDVPAYVAPQRQMSDRPTDPPATHAAMVAFLEALAAANPALLATRPSHLEGVGTPALYTRPTATSASTEFCHVHYEASSHLILSLPDGAQVMRHGWAERHRLAGARFPGLPASYLFVYAPRDADEMQLWRRLVVAAAGFAVAGEHAIVLPETEA